MTTAIKVGDLVKGARMSRAKPIQVGDLVRIEIPEESRHINQKGVWLVVDIRGVNRDWCEIVQGTDKRVLLKYDLEKVPE